MKSKFFVATSNANSSTASNSTGGSTSTTATSTDPRNRSTFFASYPAPVNPQPLNYLQQQQQQHQQQQQPVFAYPYPNGSLVNVPSMSLPMMAPNPQTYIDNRSSFFSANQQLSTNTMKPLLSQFGGHPTLVNQTSQPVLGAVNTTLPHNLLKEGHQCVASLDAVISLGTMVQSSRQISLVKSGNTFGFFIWITNHTTKGGMQPTTGPLFAFDTNHHFQQQSLMNGGVHTKPNVAFELDNILPIDSRFHFELNSSTDVTNNPLLRSVVGSTDVSLKIVYSSSDGGDRPTRASASSNNANGGLFEDILSEFDVMAIGTKDATTVKPNQSQLSFTFNLSYNPNTELFVSHLQSAVEAFNAQKPTAGLFAWLLEYQPRDTLLASLSESILPDEFVRSLRVGALHHPTVGQVTMSASSQQQQSRPIPSSKTVIQSSSSVGSINKGGASVLGFEDNFHPVPQPPPAVTHRKVEKSASSRSSNTTQLVFDEQHFSPSAPASSTSRSTSGNGSRGSPVSPHHNFDDDSDSLNGKDDNSREYLIRLLTENRENEYIRPETYRILIGTWNVNGQLSREENEMRTSFLACDKEAPDFYAIGFQELDLSKEAYIFDNFQKEEYWMRMCADSLHPDKEYVLLKSDRLIGMMIAIFVNKKLQPYINNCQAAHVGTGILGKMGNKGGVAIRFDLHETSLCFVNCHLAAHVEQYERRNQDFREINSRLQFPQGLKPAKRIENHDQIYWFGDLNYRVMNLTTEQIKSMCDRGQYAAILEHDQLKRQKDAKNCFQGYIEGPITHLPSYKYNTGTDEWDSSEKKRPPAWCDRILFKGQGIHLKVYRSHPELKASDHKPVSALFDSNFRVVDSVAKRKVYEDVMKKLDKEENDYLPQVEIDTTEINFGVVRYKECTSRVLKLKNVGHSRIKYRFINKPNEPSYCKEWLQITPASAYIAIQETVEIKLELTFDSPLISTKLNYGLDRMEDTLVLSLRGGKDIFITVVGDYRPSCFGCSLESLLQITSPLATWSVADLKARYGEAIQLTLDPVRSKQYEIEKKKETNLSLLLNLETLDSNVNSERITMMHQQLVSLGSNAEQNVPIPKELWMLVDYLYKKPEGMTKEELFQCSGSETDFVRIREALDRADQNIMSGVAYDSAAEAIMLFLQALPEPVIPFRFYDRVIQNRNNFSNCRQVINELPEGHRRVFQYLILFLKELCKYTQSNKLDARIIAKIFGPVLVRRFGSDPTNAMEEPPLPLPPPPVAPPRSSPKPGRSNLSSSSLLSQQQLTSSRATFYSPPVMTAQLSDSSSSSSFSSEFGTITLTPEQTFIYLFLINGNE